MKRITNRQAFILLSLLLLSLVLASCNNSISDKGKLNIIAMGDDFTGTSLELHSCENDADAAVEVFEKLAADSGMPIGVSEGIIGKENATPANLTNALETVKNSASANDLTVIFLSTHGHNDVKTRVDYSQSNRKNAYFLLGNGDVSYSFDTLLTKANEIPGTVLILADLCYSGAFIEQNNITFNIDNYSGTNPVNILFSDGVVRESSKVFILAASTYFQLSYAGNPLSVFSNYMLKSLGLSSYDAEHHSVNFASSIPAKNGNKILLSDIYAYIYKESKRDNKAQVVQMSAGTNDLVLFSF